MIEYPSIISSSKAPRKPMMAFEKLDGSNVRVKWTAKRGFHLFGSRTQLFDASHLELGGAVQVFNSTCKDELDELLRKHYGKEKEIVAYGEYLGPNSFAGVHADPVDKMRFVLFDIMIHKKTYTEFLLPQDFMDLVDGTNLPTPPLLYEGTLGEAFIHKVRQNDFTPPLREGVVCKGTKKSATYNGRVWMCKVKTLQYMEKLKLRYGNNWEKFWE